MKTVDLFADGGCSQNPGKGGFGVILKYNGHEKELSCGYTLTTNNRMEIQAVISGLLLLKEPCIVNIYSDSKYVVDAVEKGWVYSWKKNNWLKSDKKKAQNIDLWEELLSLLKIHKASFFWVKGHDGHPENERCDFLAVEAYKKDDLKEDKGYVL